jgi:hypothetical protein
MGPGGEAHQNETRGNYGSGLVLGLGAGALGGIATGNRALENGQIGLEFPPNDKWLYSKNVASGNPLAVRLGVSLGDNLCNGALC